LLLCGPAPAGDFRVKTWKVLLDKGGRVAWSAANGLIAFDRAGPNGYYDVWTMREDGSNQVCLTCLTTALPNLHKGNPEWHPSGNYIVFQAQKAPVLLGDNLGAPGVGINNDLWIMDAQGKQYWRVTDVPLWEGGVLHAHFSHAGDKLLWAERISSASGLSGLWAMKLADVSFVSGAPVIGNIQTLTPGQRKIFYETHGFSPDDKTIFFSGSLSVGQPDSGIDVHSLELATGTLTNLTNTWNDWDEHGRPAPAGTKLVWMSSTNVYSPQLGQLKAEYWMMEVDGSSKNQLTWFNDPRGPDYIEGGVVAGDSDWSPDGTKLIAYLVEGGTGLGGGGKNVLLEFEPAATAVSAASFWRPPVAPDMIVSIFGTGLANSVGWAQPPPPLPLEIAGTSVTIQDARGLRHQAPLFFVSPLQVNCTLPAGVAHGPAVLTVTNGSGGQLRVTIDIEAVAPGVFTANVDGQGAPAAEVVRVSSDGTQSRQPAYDCSAGPGRCTTRPVDLGVPADKFILELYGTGFRNRSSLAGVTARIGGVDAPVEYAGPQNQFEGLDQINVQIPRNLAGAGVVAVALTVDGVLANTVRIQTK
jgi:uncharacterized protein (TIGR03437 family)